MSSGAGAAGDGGGERGLQAAARREICFWRPGQLSGGGG
jgi:hypothetical protein